MAPAAAGTIESGALDLRRMWQLVRAAPTDHADEARLEWAKDFSLDKTIFYSLRGWVRREMVASRVGVRPFWSDGAAVRITEAYAAVPRAPAHDLALKDFLSKECNFGLEHADGSFADHLKFCYEYSFVHYRQHSPRVLLLHSILGVGTNFFPMDKQKIPALRALLTEFEFAHVQAFPSVLRLLYHGALLDKLVAMDAAALRRISGLRCHRVIDNAEVELDGTNFWVMLNFQLVHLLDFLPLVSWKLHADDAFLDNFVKLLAVLQRAGKLEAKVDFNASEGKSDPDALPGRSLGSMLRGVLPSKTLLRASRDSMADFSKQIGHNLSFELLTATKGAAL